MLYWRKPGNSIGFESYPHQDVVTKTVKKPTSTSWHLVAHLIPSSQMAFATPLAISFGMSENGEFRGRQNYNDGPWLLMKSYRKWAIYMLWSRTKWYHPSTLATKDLSLIFSMLSGQHGPVWVQDIQLGWSSQRIFVSITGINERRTEVRKLEEYIGIVLISICIDIYQHISTIFVDYIIYQQMSTINRIVPTIHPYQARCLRSLGAKMVHLATLPMVLSWWFNQQKGWFHGDWMGYSEEKKLSNHVIIPSGHYKTSSNHGIDKDRIGTRK